MAEIPSTYFSNSIEGIPDKSYFSVAMQAKMLDALILPKLVWDTFMPPQTIDTEFIEYWIETDGAGTGTRGSADTDVKKQYFAPKTDGAEFTYFTFSLDEKKVSNLSGYQAAFALTEGQRQNARRRGVDPARKPRSRLVYWGAQKINTDMLTSLTNTFSVTNTDSTTMAQYMTHIATDIGTETTVGNITGKLDSTYYWDEPDADPVLDILQAKRLFDGQAGYPYEATDVYMSHIDMGFLSDFITRRGGTWEQSPLGGGYMATSLAGLTIHPMKDVDGFAFTAGDGYIYMVDKNNPPGETFVTFSTEYPRSSLFNFKQYENHTTNEWHYKFWYTRGTVVKEPLAQLVLQVRD